MLTEIIEAMLFAAGHGLMQDVIYTGLGTEYSKKEIDEAIKEIRKRYAGDRGIVLIEYNKKFQLQSNPKYGDILADTLKETRERELSKTLLKVLAIIAYKQPITRPEIEELRGVSADYVIAMLLKLNLIEPKGRKEALGNPILYGTTDEFLRKFGITDLSELPDYDALMEKIRNNYEKYHAKSTGLYRERDIDMDTSEEPLTVSLKTADDINDNEFPEFLEGEKDVEEFE
jgi:segregation and condensation protein B